MRGERKKERGCSTKPLSYGETVKLIDWMVLDFTIHAEAGFSTAHSGGPPN